MPCKSLQTRFSGTDLYPYIRNYKPLLELLYNDPEKAYDTYQQFQLFPLCFEDSVAAEIACLELKPVEGPSNKTTSIGATREAELISSFRKIDQLENLLYSRRGTGKGMQTQSLLPDQYELRNPYPNPFNSVVSFHFTIPKVGKTSYTVYDALGRQVFKREMGELQAGKYLAS